MGTGERPGTVVLTDTQTSPISSTWSGPIAIGNFPSLPPRSGCEFWILGSLGRISITKESRSISASVYSQQTWATQDIKTTLLPAWSPTYSSQSFNPLLLFPSSLSVLLLSVFGFLPCRSGNHRQCQDNFIFKSRHISMKEKSLDIFVQWLIYFQLPGTSCWSWATQLITIPSLLFYILNYLFQPNL